MLLAMCWGGGGSVGLRPQGGVPPGVRCVVLSLGEEVFLLTHQMPARHSVWNHI